ncbi:MAG: hypothetical protein NWR08_08840 [Opitutales bacterium]|nr:hypothetical protein [Opitutales bacterium]
MKTDSVNPSQPKPLPAGRAKWFDMHNLLRVTSLCICINLPATAQPEQFLLRGVFEYKDQLQFSILHRESGQCGWIVQGRNFQGLQLESYNQVRQQAHGFYMGQPITIDLPTPKHGLPLWSEHPETSESLPQTEQSIAQLQLSLYEQLPPKDDPLHLPMKQSVDNRIAEMRASLKDDGSMPQTNLEQLDTVGETAITSTKITRRTRNYVNSRIWASDHIKIHGLAPLSAP